MIKFLFFSLLLHFIVFFLLKNPFDGKDTNLKKIQVLHAITVLRSEPIKRIRDSSNLQSIPKESDQSQKNKNKNESKGVVLKSDYIQQIYQFIDQHKSYPQRALRDNLSSRAIVRVRVNSDGSFTQTDIIKSTNYDWFDQAILDQLAMLKMDTPFPKEMSQEYIELEIPFVFEMN